MNRTIVALLVILTIVGSLAAPKDHKDKKEHKRDHKDHKDMGHKDHKEGRHGPHGHHMHIDFSSCVKSDTIENMKKAIEVCKSKMADSSTTSTTTTTTTAEASGDAQEGEHKHHRNCDAKRRMMLMCIGEKISQMIVAAKPASSLDAIEFIARNNLTEEAQQQFINATSACFTKENIQIQELTTKQDTKMEDWKPVMHCLNYGMHKSCKEKVMPSTTPSTSGEADASSTTAASETSIELENDDEE